MISPLLIVGCSLPLFLVFQYFIFPVFLSPLSKIPNAHFTSSFSPAWILWKRKAHHENRAILAAHERCGPVVRLGPNEISINCIEGGLRTVYGNFERHIWYTNAFQNYGIPNLVTMSGFKQHSERKRMVTNIYSKSYIQNSEDMKKVSAVTILDKLLPLIHSSATAGTPVEVLELLTATNMDFTGAYIFGLNKGTNFLGDPQYRKHWLHLYLSRKPYSFWVNELPTLGRFLRKLGINVFPTSIDHASHEIENWCLEMCQAAAEASKSQSQAQDPSTTEAIVYNQLASRIAKSSLPPDTQLKVVASEMLDQLLAGAETSSVTLTYLMHELSSRPSLQSALRTELLTLSPPIAFPPHQPSEPPLLPSSRTLDELPLLDALITETLRLHGVNPGPQPRITPPGTSTIGGYANIPAGVRVSANAYTLHRNASVFPSPEKWDPYRWINVGKEEEKEMRRWWWAFSSGGRMCVGLHLALHEMKLIVAAIYTNYTTAIIDDAGIEQEDAFIARPKGNKLVLSFSHI
ncbi:hypothetical protein MMC30_008642 [Trapelia coarctata]|nr:hypothetical protein [Trapelia coarctata]